jgi:hypothetical protein
MRRGTQCSQDHAPLPFSALRTQGAVPAFTLKCLRTCGAYVREGVGVALALRRKVVIDNSPCLREALLPCRSQHVIELRPQESRSWRYMHAPTRPILHGIEAISSILNLICAHV